MDRYWPSLFVLLFLFIAFDRYRNRETRPMGWIQVKLLVAMAIGMVVVGTLLHSPYGGWLRTILKVDPRSEAQIRIASKP
jgi:hypothetical protein